MPITVYRTTYKGPNQAGDFSFHAKCIEDSGRELRTCFVYTDNSKGTASRGSASIKSEVSDIYSHGIPVLDENNKPFQSASEVGPYLEESLEKPFTYNEGYDVFIPVDPKNRDLIGCGAFNVPVEVRSYIMTRILHKIQQESRDGKIRFVDI